MMMKLCAAYREVLLSTWFGSSAQSSDVKKTAFVDAAVGFAKSEYHVLVSKLCSEGEAVLGGEGTVIRVSFGRGGSLLRQLRFQMGVP